MINIDVDRAYEYDGYNSDFGPLTMSQIHMYCQQVRSKISTGKRVVHYCSSNY